MVVKSACGVIRVVRWTDDSTGPMSARAKKLHREPSVPIVYIFLSREPRLSGSSLYVHIYEWIKNVFVRPEGAIGEV